MRTSPPCPRGPFCGTGRSNSDSVLPWVERSRKASTQSRKIGREAFQPGSLQRVTVVTSLSGTLGEWTVAKAPRRAHPLDDVPASLSPQSEVTRSFRATISGCPSGQRPDTTSPLRAKGPWLWSGVEPRLGHAVPGTPAPGTGDSARRQSAEASQTPEPMAFPHDLGTPVNASYLCWNKTQNRRKPLLSPGKNYAAKGPCRLPECTCPDGRTRGHAGPGRAAALAFGDHGAAPLSATGRLFSPRDLKTSFWLKRPSLSSGPRDTAVPGPRPGVDQPLSVNCRKGVSSPGSGHRSQNLRHAPAVPHLQPPRGPRTHLCPASG